MINKYDIMWRWATKVISGQILRILKSSEPDSIESNEKRFGQLNLKFTINIYFLYLRVSNVGKTY